MAILMNFSDELSSATRDAHARLEALPFAAALAEGSLPLESYVGYLRGMVLSHNVMEHELPIETDARIASVWDEDMRRLPALQRDLAYFNARVPANVPSDIPAAQQKAYWLANRLLTRSTEMPLSLLGSLYVFEGSTLGAAVLGPQAQRAFKLDTAHGCAYLDQDAQTTRTRWRSFRGRLDALDLSEGERAAILDAALETYRGIEGVLSALYPFDPDQLVLSATSLNADAGAHPVTQDPLELEAARRAGERSLEAYPYCIWRYGERGRRFADSDGAWLVTLVNYPQALVNRQVAWLGGVLATRGIPRLLLQRHLELLHQELCLRVPGPKADYRKLLIAADSLADIRRAYLSDADLDRLCSSFDRAIGPDFRARLPGVAAIIISALIDEASGLTGVRDSVGSWFTDPARFPEGFISAVRDLERDAQSCLPAAQEASIASHAKEIMGEV
jgi:heme oxygenase